MTLAGAPSGQLSAELLGQASAELKALQAVIKVFGCPIAPADLDRMRAGGVQDRKDDLMRLTANQLTDVVIFSRLLSQFIEGAKQKRYPQGQAIELMGRTIGAPVSQRVVGSSMAGPPKVSLGLRATTGGASLKQQASHAHDKQLGELVAKVLTLHPTQIPRDAFVPLSQPLERVTKFIDPVLLQRVCRDTVRSCPATAAQGMDGLRLLSPLADAMEFALQRGALEAAWSLAKEVRATVQNLALAEQGRLAPVLGKDGHTVASLIEKLVGLDAGPPQPASGNDEGTQPLPEGFKRAAAATLGVDLKTQQGNFAAAVYRRVVIAESPQGAAVLALATLLAALAPAGVSLPPALAAHALASSSVTETSSAAKGTWPALKPEELQQLADRLFGGKAEDALPGSPAPMTRSPAKLLLTLRGDWVIRTSFLQVCEAGAKSAAPPRQQNLVVLATFLKGLAASAREELLLGLYQMATGDPDQRARQIGAYFAEQAAAVLKPGLTLGPLRVAFAKHWRQVEGRLFA